MPHREMKNFTWFSRPGTASIFTPREGIAQEWRTSAEDTNTRIGVWAGSISRLSTSSKRGIPEERSEVGIMYESNSNSR